MAGSELDLKVRATRAAAGFATNAVQLAVNATLQVALAPLVIRTAGQETLGAYAALSQALVWLNLLDLGFENSTTRFLAQAFGSKDPARFARVLAAIRAFYARMNIACAVTACLLAIYLPPLLNLRGINAAHARWSMFLVGIWALVRIPIAVFNFALIGRQHLASSNMISTGASVMRFALAVWFTASGAGLFGIVSAGILSDAANLVFQRRYFTRITSEPLLSWRHVDKPLCSELLRFSTHSLMMTAAAYSIFFSDNLLISHMFGPSAAAVFYATIIPAQLALSVIMRLMNNALPAVNELWARGEVGTVQETYYRIVRYTLLMGFPFSFALVALNRTAITLWVGADRYAGDGVTLAFALYAPLELLANVHVQYLFAAGRSRLTSRLSIAYAGLKLGLSVTLAPLLGPSALVLSTLTANALVTPWRIWACSRYLGFSVRRLSSVSVMPSLAAALPWVVLIPAARQSPSLLILLSAAAVAPVWLFCAYRLGLRPEERARVTALLARFGALRRVAGTRAA